MTRFLSFGMISFAIMAPASMGWTQSEPVEPLPIDPLWKSESFLKLLTGSYGIDSRIEPRITVDEEFYLSEMAQALSDGNRAKAIETLFKSDLLDRSPALCFQLGCLEFEEGNLDEAVAHLKEALEQFPNFRDAHRNLAVALIQKTEYEEAFEHLVRAVELGSRDALTMGLLGYYHARNEDHQAALDAYRIASITQPKEKQWKIGEAQALQNLGEFEKAAKIYGALLEEEPTDSILWLTEADTLLSQGKTLPALSNLEFVYRMEGLSPEATLSLGHLYLQSDLPDKAIERYETALKAEPPVELASMLETVEMFLSKQDFARAETLLGFIDESSYGVSLKENSVALDLAGKWERSHALIQIERGDSAAGAERLTQWLEKEPTDGLALMLLSRYHESAGNREEAEMMLEQAAALPDHEAEALKVHGKLLVSFREFEEALPYLQKSQSLEPSESLASYITAVQELAD